MQRIELNKKYQTREGGKFVGLWRCPETGRVIGVELRPGRLEGRASERNADGTILISGVSPYDLILPQFRTVRVKITVPEWVKYVRVFGSGRFEYSKCQIDCGDWIPVEQWLKEQEQCDE